jgi:transcriptional repressor NrdR
MGVMLMICPFCGFNDSKVIDSRDVENTIRRRRQCLSCNARFTTYERVQQVNLMVIKKDKRREEFNRNKLLTGIQKACEKRPLPIGTIDKIVEEIEAQLYKTGKAEISSNIIGEMVMEKLKKVDFVAYIRFASVYREFADISTLKKEIDSLLEPKAISAISNQLPLIPNESLELVKTFHRSKR